MLKKFKLLGIFGLGILMGTMIPWANWFQALTSQADPLADAKISEQQKASAAATQEEIYHFILEQGKLAVRQGKIGEAGPTLIQGMDTRDWPVSVLEAAADAEFYSLDEVQSYIDSIHEAL
ncbi:MAG: hypothetical protein LBT22_04905 [Peptococcaceae bacterium]|jgi:hypothetical protein|nr:hypothetical protein [Peptococcaceae bacterium]